MSVVTSMEEAGPCRVKVTIEVPAPAVEAEVGRVVQDFRKQAQLPGFRKGKIPPKVIEKRFKSEIESEVTDRLLPRYWQQAQAEKGLDPLLPPTVEDLKFETGKPLIVVAVVETRPEIALGDISNFDLPADSTDVSDDEIEENLTGLRRRFAEWEVVDREAAQGDLVVASMRDLDAEDDAEERPLHLEIGSEGSDEELGLALTGKAAGAKFEHTSSHGEGEEAHVHRYEVTVREVKEQELPELDDEFAKTMGDFENLEAMREALSASLADRKKSDLSRRRQEALMEQLRERHPLTLPEGVVQQEAERMVQEQASQMARQGIDLETVNLDWGAMVDQIRPVAINRVHERLVLDAIAKAEELKLDEEKFEQFLAAAAADQRTSSLALRQRLDQDGRLETLRSQLLREQTIGHLLGELGDEAEDSETESEEE